MTTPPEKDISLLVVDMWWEEEIKNRERGFAICFNEMSKQYEKMECQQYPQRLQYPTGTLHAGLDAIHDVVRKAHLLGKKIYGVVNDDGYSPPDELLDKSLHPYIPKEHFFMKNSYSAFNSKPLITRLEEDAVDYLLIVGFDRDCCVLSTIQDAVKKGITIVTSETLMLTCNVKDRNIALDYCRKNTIYLESLVEVLNVLDPHGKLAFIP